MLIAGIAGLAIRVALIIHNRTYDWGDVVQIAGSASIAVVGLYTLRSSRA
jgi:hypothetical protein